MRYGVGGFGLRVAGCFERSEPRATAAAHVRGLLADVPRKNGWQLTGQAGAATSWSTQRLLGPPAGRRTESAMSCCPTRSSVRAEDLHLQPVLTTGYRPPHHLLTTGNLGRLRFADASCSVSTPRHCSRAIVRWSSNRSASVKAARTPRTRPAVSRPPPTRSSQGSWHTPHRRHPRPPRPPGSPEGHNLPGQQAHHTRPAETCTSDREKQRLLTQGKGLGFTGLQPLPSACAEARTTVLLASTNRATASLQRCEAVKRGDQ